MLLDCLEMPAKRNQARSILTAWAIGITLMAAVLLAAWLIRGRGRVTPMTSFGANAANYSGIQLPLDPAAVVDGWPQQQEDASHLYDLIAETYSAGVLTRRAYDDFLRDSVRRPANPGDLPLVAHLVEAGRQSTATLFADEPETLINYDRDLPRLDGLYVVGQCAIKQAGLVAGRGHPGDAAEARRLYEAALILGVRLCEERIVHRELEHGYRLIGQSLGGLVALAKKQDEVERAARLADERDRFSAYVNAKIQPVWDKLSAINILERSDDLADRHFGDVLAIAQREAADPLWRLEAILRLGKGRHDASSAADRSAAHEVLEGLKSIDDPHLKLAVEQAMSLSAAERMNAR